MGISIGKVAGSKNERKNLALEPLKAKSSSRKVEVKPKFSILNLQDNKFLFNEIGFLLNLCVSKGKIAIFRGNQKKTQGKNDEIGKGQRYCEGQYRVDREFLED